MTSDEFESYWGEFPQLREKLCEVMALHGYFVREDMWGDSRRSAIFSGGSGTSTTSNGGMLTWTIPNTNNSNQSTPTVKVALYRRSTHDEKGNYKQFTPTQEQLWKDLAVVATMTNALAWKSVDEIFRDATDYRNRMIGGKKEYISRGFVEQSLEILCNNGLIEKNDA